VILRALQASDANELAILLNNKNIWDHVRDYLPYPYTLLDAVKFIEMQKDNQNDLIYAIQADGILAGCISLSLKSDVYKLNGEIGFWLGEPFGVRVSPQRH
jgi:RimJ/RimL family protein N-acetyltransferase